MESPCCRKNGEKKNEIRKQRENQRMKMKRKEQEEENGEGRIHIYAFLRGTVTCAEKLNDVT